MPPDPTPEPSKSNLPASGTLPSSTASPPIIGAPPLPPNPAPKAGFWRQSLVVILSLCLGLFVVDGLVSLLDDTLILVPGVRVLTSVRLILGMPTLLLAALVYCLMAIVPAIPKRLFVPVTLFTPAAMLAAMPLVIYFYGRLPQIAWLTSLAQVICGLVILWRVQGRFTLRWPLVAESQLASKRFSWAHFVGFVLVNLVVLLPLAGVYVFLCSAHAVDHFTDGFLTLRPSGFTVNVRTYVREDGKTIRLIPMAHVGEPDFYWKLSQAFPTNSTILMEGVTDNQNLLTNRITYKRMAESLGLTEQVREFRPRAGEMVMADLDVGEFTPDTIGFLNLVMLIHAQGVNAGNVLTLLQFSPPPQFEKQLFDDLLKKRNRHLLEEIKDRLPDSEYIIVPWGVAHIPEIAREIQKSGFRLAESQEYQVIRFRSGAKKSRTTKTAGNASPVASPAERADSNGPIMADVLAASGPGDWRELDAENTLYLELASGRVVIELAPAFAPRHVANVKALAREKYYDGLAIVRVQDNYVVQWADPDAEKPEAARKIQHAQKTLRAEFEREFDPQLPFTRLPDSDVYAPEVGFSSGFPVARDPASGKMWLLHCYAMVGAGRDNSPDSGGGTELYAVIGHAPRHLDRNVTLLGRVVQGIELLSALPRGTGRMGFHEKPAQNVPIKAIRVAADVPEAERSALEIMRTDTPAFQQLIESRRNRREEWFQVPAGRIEIGNVPVPLRPRSVRAGRKE